MPVRFRHRQPPSRAVAALALLALGSGMSGCAEIGENMTSAYADPARYDLYECKQLEPERKTLAARAAELQGLMAKAETATGGTVIAEIAYRNDYITARAQSKLAEEAWRRNKCQDTPPVAATPDTPPAPSAGVKGLGRPARSSSAIR